MSLRKIFSLSLLLAAVALGAVNADAGTTGFNNLKLIYSARAMGMGSAFTGLPGNIESMQFNPAGMLNLKDKQLASTFSSYWVDTNAGALHFLYPKNEYVTYGAFLQYLNYGQMDRTELTQNNEYLDTGEKFGASDIIAGVSIARYVNASIDVGGSAKFIYDAIDDKSATAVVLDGGLVHHPFNQKIKVGVSIRNLGVQTSYYTSKKYAETLPLTFAAGLSYQISPVVLTSVDISKPRGQDLTGKLGVEYKIDESFDLRAGFNSNRASWQTGGSWEWLSGLTFGGGWKWKKYAVDYGMASYGDLGFVHQVTLNYKF